MQKFTRDLTREVEIDGERLALTMSEKGLAVRPVGSRKPPLELTWASIIAFVRSQADCTIPTAASVALSPLASAPGGLAGILARLDAWLATHRPGMHATLRPGATDPELMKLGEVLGKPIPDDLATWLRWHNGQGEDVPAYLVGAFGLLSTTEIAEELLERQAGTDGPWERGWIPLLSDFSGDLVCLDTTRPGTPLVESWRGRSKADEVAPSLLTYLEKLLADFEAGRYVEDEERGEYHRKR